MEANQILDISMEVGISLLENGAEIKRVEETIKYICDAYGAQNVEVFAIPNFITITIKMPDGQSATSAKRCYDIEIDLFRVDRFNSLSRKICKDKPDFETVKNEISRINSKKDYNIFLLILGAILGAAAFTIFFGGTWRDAISSGIAAIFMIIVKNFKIKGFNHFFHTLVISLVGGAICLLTTIIGLGENLALIMMGAIMLLIPGLMTSISIKDILIEDVVSGSIRFIQSLLNTISIVFGFAIFAFIGGKFNTFAIPSTNPYHFVILLIAGVIGTFGFSVIFNSKYNRLIPAIIGGLISTFLYLIFNEFTNNFFSSLVAATVVCIYSEIMARINKAADTSYILPGLIILAPGASLFLMVYNLIGQQNDAAIEALKNFGLGALGIALGILLVSISLNIIKQIKLKLKSKKVAKN